MEFNEQIKQALAPSARSRQIFRNFRDATVAILDCDELRADVRDAVCQMMDLFNGELGGADEPASENAYRVMSNVFDLHADDDAEDVIDKDSGVVTRDVAGAFDVIKRYERVLPESIVAPLDEAIGAFNEAEDVEAHEEAARAARELAGAFASIEQWRDYMPADIYNPIQEALMEWIINDAKFLHNPTSLRAGLPGIFRGIFEVEEEEDAA